MNKKTSIVFAFFYPKNSARNQKIICNKQPFHTIINTEPQLFVTIRC